jgi:hypothetical protein
VVVWALLLCCCADWWLLCGGGGVQEIDPTVEVDTGDVLDSASQNLIAELASTLPGIDEAMSFAELMK